MDKTTFHSIYSKFLRRGFLPFLIVVAHITDATLAISANELVISSSSDPMKVGATRLISVTGKEPKDLSYAVDNSSKSFCDFSNGSNNKNELNAKAVGSCTITVTEKGKGGPDKTGSQTIQIEKADQSALVIDYQGGSIEINEEVEINVGLA